MPTYNKNIDLTVIGNVLWGDGIGRHSPAIINTLYDQFSINALQLPPCNYSNIPKEALKIFMQPFTGFGKVSLYVYILGLDNKAIDIHRRISSPIKMAYSMFESDAIPKLWVNILNTYYDMLVVPDPYLVKIYKNSGVKIPIFIVPLGIMVENLLARPIKTKANDIFTFGMSAGFWKRKNHIKILEAFGKKFGNDPKFKLKLHGRFGSFKSEVEKAVAQANYKNVELLSSPLSMQAYDDFMDQIDCYVFPSMGEGFSITPREALALGKPCILSNNSCHKTICDSGFVIPLASNVKTPAHYEIFKNQQIGYYSDCSVVDLADSMKKVVDNYDQYLSQAHGGREWVKQYLWSSLKPTYLGLINPKNIVKGLVNEVGPNCLTTDNDKLFKKLNDTFK